MIGFWSGFACGFLLWVAFTLWHRSRLAKVDKVWMSVVREVEARPVKAKKAKRRK